MLLLQTWIISVLQNVEERVAEVLRKLFLMKNDLRITHVCWSKMIRFAKMGLQMHPRNHNLVFKYQSEIFST